MRSMAHIGKERGLTLHRKNHFCSAMNGMEGAVKFEGAEEGTLGSSS
jgi:hypothetical protein